MRCKYRDSLRNFRLFDATVSLLLKIGGREFGALRYFNAPAQGGPNHIYAQRRPFAPGPLPAFSSAASPSGWPHAFT